MRAPLNWLAEYVELPSGATALEVAADLVRVGLEEEAVHGGDVTGPLVVGRVLEFTPEPQKNGKTIRWCQVDVGEGTPRGIVCGAGNFVEGDLVVVCLPGAVLPGGFAITARKTYGHKSDGMICSAKEIGLGEDHDGIIRLTEWGFDDAAPGDDAIALLGLAEETVEVNVTPDRGYCFSLRGIAREYSHATGARFTDPALVEVPAASADGFAVELDDQAPINGVPGGDRFVARVVRGVDATATSPRWMQKRLEQAGMRPISLAVDVTNYVMLAVGHPLHAFDLDKLAAPIVVRRAVAGEKLTTLDDVERTLHTEDLLVTDSPQGRGSRVLSLAGVMGGASSEVSAETTNLLVEAAHWDPITVARTMRRHKLSTEAGKRYERGVDTRLADVAAELTVRLLVEYGGEKVEIGPVTDVGEAAPGATIEMPADFPGRIVGLDYTREQVVENLEQIGCEVSGDDVLTVQAPSWRPDLLVPVDLAEEVARLRGYDQIPAVLPVAPAGRGLTHGQRVRRSVARALAEYGGVEVLTYPFIGAAVHDAFGLPKDDARRTALKLANPLSDEQPYMRTSLLATLVEAAKRNVGRGFTDLALYEIGAVVRPTGSEPKAGHPGVAQRPSEAELEQLNAAIPHQPLRAAIVLAGQRELPGWEGPGRPADWSDALEAALLVARTVNVQPTVTKDENHAPWHPGRCARLEIDGQLFGHAGELHPKVVAALGLPPRTVAAEVDLDVLIAASGQIVTARPISSFPLAKEDVALVVENAVQAQDVHTALVDGAGELLESVRLFDVYTGTSVPEGHKSLAFALRFRAPDRTLTAEETAAARDAAVALAAERTGAVLRG
ncbi:phenylalanine--tRNA ligase subunit beta [Kineosporia rhizophila]|uniref:phenylalanine--tRNA ligase subunit beta n=1 Tax=Kineosporia TaxID=49184 RepID=UPI001E629D26|nr:MULTISPECIES: phenylalanine--tRNA ligase subunit beta [Kineosporia]MCE0538401.1 phenylalanine--tRNA ligase subunit beta [Kineosporia rhizophila]GLY18539.1 phenylalanine--tRNA ligase beta subunit [Kineosporia sp. NBRC 101677]